MDPSHPPATDTHTACMCVCVSCVVSRCFLAGVWRESAHGERGGHPDEAWRRKNEVWGEFMHYDRSVTPPVPLPPPGVLEDETSNIFLQRKDVWWEAEANQHHSLSEFESTNILNVIKLSKTSLFSCNEVGTVTADGWCASEGNMSVGTWSCK